MLLAQLGNQKLDRRIGSRRRLGAKSELRVAVRTEQSSDQAATQSCGNEMLIRERRFTATDKTSVARPGNPDGDPPLTDAQRGASLHMRRDEVFVISDVQELQFQSRGQVVDRRLPKGITLESVVAQFRT